MILRGSLIRVVLGATLIPLLEDNFRQPMLMSQGGLAILTVIALSRSALASRMPAVA